LYELYSPLTTSGGIPNPLPNFIPRSYNDIETSKKSKINKIKNYLTKSIKNLFEDYIMEYLNQKMKGTV